MHTDIEAALEDITSELRPLAKLSGWLYFTLYVDKGFLQDCIKQTYQLQLRMFSN